MKYDYDIIFPFYKDYRYLVNCIKNINKQTILAKKIIFIDDGNNNIKLKKIVRKALNKRIKLTFISNTKNIGPQKSVENNWKKITSKFFFFVAADDIIYRNYSEENIKLLNQYPEASYIFSNLIINNEINKKKYKIRYNFLKKNFYNKKEIKDLFKRHQFKIYHNTVVFNTKLFKKNNIFKIFYGERADMLNLLFLAYKNGFVYHNKYLSEFTVRENQWGKRMSDNYLINELLILKRNQNKFYKFFISTNLHFDLSVLSMKKLIKLGLINTISFSWFARSIKFYLWKTLRFALPSKSLDLLFKIFN